MSRVVALDLGTSSGRVQVYDERGAQVERIEARTRVRAGADGGVDAVELADAVRAAVEQAVRAAGDDVAAIAASCFWHSLVAVDARGRALTPLLPWADVRAAPEADELARLLGSDALHARTGAVAHPSYWPAKLLWLKRREPDVFGAAARFLSFPDYLYGRLLGDARTSLSMASGTGMLDLAGGDWDEELLATLELEAERLPVVSDEPAGTELPWFRAVGDGACSNLGAGCTTRERAVLMVGTSGAFRTLAARARPEPRGGLFLYRLDAERVVEGGALSDGGNLHHWLVRTLASADARGLADEPPDAHGLTFLPLLGGERSPGWNARARGAIAGLSFATEPRQLVHAALEGVAFRFAEVAELMPEVAHVVATGAALHRNHDWVQILADVLERRVVLSGLVEGSARGAAVYALERLGLEPDDAPLGPVFNPRAERADAYRSARARQRRLYEGVT